jgi:hypothetical protein
LGLKFVVVLVWGFVCEGVEVVVVFIKVCAGFMCRIFSFRSNCIVCLW